MNAEINNVQSTEFEEKHNKVKRIMAAIALVAIVVSVIAACVCMVIGNMQLVIAACFCLVIVPIMAYCFIFVYDMVHKDDKKTAEMLKSMAEQAESSEQGE